MDPTTLIVSALEAGAEAGGNDAASANVRLSYARLLEALRRWSDGKPSALTALDGYQVNPEVWNVRLSEALGEFRAADDEHVIAAARLLLSASGAMAGLPSYTIDLSRGTGVQIGDGNTQTNYFLIGEVSWPIAVGRVPRRADAFQMRAEVNGSLDVAVASPGTTILVGDGGTGKTQLAAEAIRHTSADLTVWIDASSRSSIMSSYAASWARIQPRAAPLTVEGQVRLDAEAFLGWLSTTSRAWMVVLDDLFDPEDLTGLWPVGATGRVLVTTRRRDSALIRQDHAVVSVGLFTAAESLTYLATKLAGSGVGRPEILAEADGLADDLGHLPLALALAAAVIVNDAISCHEYRQRLGDRSRSLAELFPDDPGEDYPRSVEATWSLAADCADALAPRGLARHVLRLAAVLDGNGAPEAAITAEIARRYLGVVWNTHPRPQDEQEGPLSVERVRRGLRNLHRLSLLSHDPEGGPRAIQMHSLVQRASIENLDQGSLGTALRTVASAVLGVWPEAERDLEVGQALRANAAALIARDPGILNDGAGCALMRRAGRSLGEIGLVHQAVAHFRGLAVAATSLLGSNAVDTLQFRHSLAHWQGESGDLAGAVAAFEQLVDDCTRVLGPDHLATLEAGHSLADWRGTSGDATGAVAALEDVLGNQARVLGDDHPDTLSTRNDLAWWRGEAGDLDASITAYEELLDDRVRVLGPDHPDTLITRHFLVHMRWQAGGRIDAFAELKELLDDRVRVLGPDHPDTLDTRHYLYGYAGESGDLASAVSGYQQLLVDRMRILGPDHPETLATRGMLARFRGASGDVAGATTEIEQLIADQMRIVGPQHPGTLAMRSNLARFHLEAGDPQRGAEESRALLVDMQNVIDIDDPRTFAVRHLLARSLGEAGEPAAAVGAFKQLLADCTKALGSDHPEAVRSRESLAHWQSLGVGTVGQVSTVPYAGP